MEKLEDSLKFKSWLDGLKQNNVQINKIEEKFIVRKRDGEILFAMLEMDAIDERGKKLLPSVLIRGHFVAVVTCLIEKETGKKYFLLVKQRRVATGDYFYEHPAGMCDSETDPIRVAIKEVEEETGLSITKKDLRLLHPKPLFSSPGLLDEAGHFFACDIVLPKKEINKFKGREMGAAGENEFITTHLAPESEVWKLLRNTSGFMAMFMYAASLPQKDKIKNGSVKKKVLKVIHKKKPSSPKKKRK